MFLAVIGDERAAADVVDAGELERVAADVYVLRSRRYRYRASRSG